MTRIARISYASIGKPIVHRDYMEWEVGLAKVKAFSMTREFGHKALLTVGEKAKDGDITVEFTMSFENGKEVSSTGDVPESFRKNTIRNVNPEEDKTMNTTAPKTAAAPKTIAEKAKAGAAALKEAAKAPAVDARKAATSPTIPPSAQALKEKQAQEKAKGGQTPPAGKTAAVGPKTQPVAKDSGKATTKKEAPKSDLKPAAIGPIADAFAVRPQTNRDLALARLIKSFNKPVKASDLAQAVYDDAASTGPLVMVIKGLTLIIADQKLKYELVKEGKKDDSTYTLRAAK